MELEPKINNFGSSNQNVKKYGYWVPMQPNRKSQNLGFQLYSYHFFTGGNPRRADNRYGYASCFSGSEISNYKILRTCEKKSDFDHFLKIHC